MSVFVPESMPSGVGEPLCEVDCDEGGEGRWVRNCARSGMISGGGEGVLPGELNGEEVALDGSEESGLESPESVSVAMSRSGKLQDREREACGGG